MIFDTHTHTARTRQVERKSQKEKILVNPVLIRGAKVEARGGAERNHPPLFPLSVIYICVAIRNQEMRNK